MTSPQAEAPAWCSGCSCAETRATCHQVALSPERLFMTCRPHAMLDQQLWPSSWSRRWRRTWPPPGRSPSQRTRCPCKRPGSRLAPTAQRLDLRPEAQKPFSDWSRVRKVSKGCSAQSTVVPAMPPEMSALEAASTFHHCQGARVKGTSAMAGSGKMLAKCCASTFPQQLNAIPLYQAKTRFGKGVQQRPTPHKARPSGTRGSRPSCWTGLAAAAVQAPQL